MEGESEIGSSSQLDRFRSGLLSLQVLGQQDIDQLLCRLRADPDLSPISALTDSGLCSSSDVELVTLWMEADSTIPGYELIDLIGRGGMGVVWRAKQTSLNRVVALKMTSATQHTNKTLLARFEREAAAISKLSHPNIVTALDFGRFGDRLFLVMEYVSGEDLGQYVNRNGRLSESFALKLVRQIAAGLSHASRNGIIHRDIKPANILLVDHSDSSLAQPNTLLAKITDFGLAILNETEQTPEARLTTEQSTVGSPHYMAPDQLNGTLLDTRADIYSLGATMFHLLTGKAPWNGRPLGVILREKLTGNFPISVLEVSGVSLETKALVERMTAYDPSQRPGSYQELLTEIDRLIELQSQMFNEQDQSNLVASVSKSGPNAPALFAATSNTQSELQTTRDMVSAAESDSSGSPNAARSADSSRRYSTTVFRTKINWKWYPAIASFCVIASLFAWSQFKNIPRKPIYLQKVGEPTYLFDGINFPLGTISEGELEVNPGQIELGGARVSILGFRMPQWDFFRFEAQIELPSQLILDVAIGENIYADRRECAAVRFHNNEVRSGTLTRIGGDFGPGGNQRSLDTNRTRHYLEVERNLDLYVVRIDRDVENQFILPMEQGRQRELEILIVVQKDTEVSGINGDSNDPCAAVSEIIVSEMRPGNRD